MNKKEFLFIISFSLIWEAWDYIFLDWNLLWSLLNPVSNISVYFGIFLVYVEKVFILFLFVYLYKKCVKTNEGVEE